MKSYLIATAIGGVMEKPDFDYNGYDIVIAKNEKIALEKYKIKHNNSYWIPECMAKKIFGFVIVMNRAVTYHEVQRLKGYKE